MAVTPGVTMAGPFSFFSSGDKKPVAKQPEKAAPANDQDAKKSNQKVAVSIANALRKARLAGYEIDIEYKKGVATITGKISDEKQRAQVTQVVSNVDGVKIVDNRLALLKTATPKGGDPNKKTFSLKPVKRKPSQQSLARSFRPPVQQAGFNAPQGARQPNIQQIGLETAQQAPMPPLPPNAQPPADNQEMANRVAKALSGAKFSGYDMEIRFQNGTAILGGSVSSPEERSRAMKITSTVPGVQQIDNRLKVDGKQVPPTVQQVGGQRPQFAPRPGMPMRPPQGAINPAMYQGGPVGPGAGMPGPPSYGHPGSGASHMVYNSPNLPEHAWPAYASYPNSAQISYPKQYSASAWPYIGPFYPYPQIPLGWRKAQLEWDDGNWSMNFNSRTDKWWWFVNPKNW